MTHTELNKAGVAYAIRHGFSESDGQAFLDACREGQFAYAPAWQYAVDNNLPLPGPGETIRDFWGRMRWIHKDIPNPL